MLVVVVAAAVAVVDTRYTYCFAFNPFLITAIINIISISLLGRKREQPEIYAYVVGMFVYSRVSLEPEVARR